MAEVVADLVRQIEQEGVAVALVAKARRVGVVEHLHARRRERRVALREEAADLAQAAGLAQEVDRRQVGGEDVAVIDGDSLRAKQQLGGTQLVAVVVFVDDVAHDRRGDGVDEDRRDVDHCRAKEGEVPGLERAGREHGVAKAQEVRDVGAGVRVHQGGERRGADRG